jgi:hypothetical protein
MQRFSEILLLLSVLAGASGCSVRGQDLSKESFHGTIKYAAVRAGPADHPVASTSAKETEVGSDADKPQAASLIPQSVPQ